jgi:hypothetical protein
MKTTFLTLLTLILLVGCTTDETNELIEANATITVKNNSTRDAVIPNPNLGCYNVYFDPTIYTAASIQGIKTIIFQQHEWFAYSHQPANYPFHQIWCKGYPLPPNGEESENDPPTGIIFDPITGD